MLLILSFIRYTILNFAARLASILFSLLSKRHRLLVFLADDFVLDLYYCKVEFYFGFRGGGREVVAVRLRLLRSAAIPWCGQAAWSW